VPARVTISLVTYNGARWLEACLDSIAEQTCVDYELLVLDNASSDESAEIARLRAATDARIVVTTSPTNLGYAAGHNFNIFRANGEFVMLLNQDVVLDREFVGAALDGFRQLRVGAVQGRLRRLTADGEPSSVLDSTGLVMHRDRRVIARHQGELESDVDLEAGPVWGADGPAPVYRRTALMDAREPRSSGGIEVLDEDFFMYKEDVDLAWRLHRLGWLTWYEPRALAFHVRTAGGGASSSLTDMRAARQTMPMWIQRLSWRNQRLMQIKNETSTGLAQDFPWIVRREIFWAFMLLADPRRLMAVGMLAAALPATLRKRRAMSRGRSTDSA
jgi:GT2 family glycosyltransferase